MRNTTRSRRPYLVLGTVLLSACGGAAAPPPVAVAPAPVEAPQPEPAPPPAPVVRREPEPPLRDRWDAPFAVSSVGRVVPREPRAVAVVGVDSAIAVAVAELLADATVPEDDASGSDPVGDDLADVDDDVDPAGGADDPDGGDPDVAADTPDGDDLRADRGVTGGGAAPRVRPVASPREEPQGAPAEPQRAGGQAATHLVGSGDTWYGIAFEYEITPRRLAEANPGVDPERIRIGQLLRIPDNATPAAPIQHRVGQGDTLWGIARRYNVSPEEIRALNELTEDRVRVGQTLAIPNPEDPF